MIEELDERFGQSFKDELFKLYRQHLDARPACKQGDGGHAHRSAFLALDPTGKDSC